MGLFPKDGCVGRCRCCWEFVGELWERLGTDSLRTHHQHDHRWLLLMLSMGFEQRMGVFEGLKFVGELWECLKLHGQALQHGDAPVEKL